MNLKLKARYEICTRNLAQALGMSVEAVRHTIKALFSSFIFSSIYFPILGYVMLLVYMAEYDFFSYELVSTSFFAVILFMQAAIAGLIFAAFGLFSAPLCWYASRRGFNISSKEYWPLILVNVLFFAVLVLVALVANEIGFAFAVFLICAGIAVFYAVFLTGGLKLKTIAVAGLFVFTLGGSFLAPSVASGIFSSGLRVFGVGGNIPVVIRDEASPNGFEANLVLVTPTSVYFMFKDQPGFVPLSKLLRVQRVENEP